MGIKIATCCYCGARAALKLGGTVQHELACSSCGAPLHELKQMPVQPKKTVKKQHYDAPRYAKKVVRGKGKSKKKSKGWRERLFDSIEDLLDDWDDVLDVFD